jgi:protein-disulfide isomerase
MRYLVLYLVALVTLISIPNIAHAQTAECDKLSGTKRDIAHEVLKAQHPYDCCDGTIWDCVHRDKVCRLAKRLADDVCRRAGKGQSKADIERELQRRAASMMAGGTTYSSDTSNTTRAGDAGAPVTVVGYMCARCPYCSRLSPALYHSVTSGKLQGKVKFYLRLFPIRSHTNSTEGALALQAAHELGKFWPFVLHIYSIFDQFDPAKLPDCAASKGMDRQRFIDTMNAQSTYDKVVDSKKEGVRNNVNATPTLYINGRKYTGDLSITAVEDVLEEEWERVTDKKYVP